MPCLPCSARPHPGVCKGMETISFPDSPALRGLPAVADNSDTREELVAELFDRHYDRLCDLAYLIIRDTHLAEEIVMEALIKTYTGWGRIRDTARADVYLKRSVVNLCRSKIRRKIVERRVNELSMHEDNRRVKGWTPDVHETARELWGAVKGLPVRQRACIILRYVEDLPEGEIAEIMGCSASTVRSQLTRARAKLARSLATEKEEATA